MDQKRRNLMIIFGSTSGLGKALYIRAAKDADNDLILINRLPLRSWRPSKSVTRLTLDLGRPLRPANVKPLWRLLKRAGRYAKVSIICNAATVKPVSAAGTFRLAEVERAWFTNVFNYSILLNEFIRRLKRFKNDKKIIVISSGAVDSPHHGLGLYCASKAALEMLTRCIFMEQKKIRQVRIMAIRPGIMNTGMQASLRQSSASNFARVKIYRGLLRRGALAKTSVVAARVYGLLDNAKAWRQAVLTL